MIKICQLYHTDCQIDCNLKSPQSSSSSASSKARYEKAARMQKPRLDLQTRVGGCQEGNNNKTSEIRAYCEFSMPQPLRRDHCEDLPTCRDAPQGVQLWDL